MKQLQLKLAPSAGNWPLRGRMKRCDSHFRHFKGRNLADLFSIKLLSRVCPLGMKKSANECLCFVCFFAFVGVTALSEFHTNFLDSLHGLTRKCVTKRDALMKQLLEAKDNAMDDTAASTTYNETLNSTEHGEAHSWQIETNGGGGGGGSKPTIQSYKWPTLPSTTLRDEGQTSKTRVPPAGTEAGHSMQGSLDPQCFLETNYNILLMTLFFTCMCNGTHVYGGLHDSAIWKPSLFGL